jgi:hypothetical protein
MSKGKNDQSPSLRKFKFRRFRGNGGQPPGPAPSLSLPQSDPPPQNPLSLSLNKIQTMLNIGEQTDVLPAESPSPSASAINIHALEVKNHEDQDLAETSKAAPRVFIFGSALNDTFAYAMTLSSLAGIDKPSPFHLFNSSFAARVGIVPRNFSYPPILGTEILKLAISNEGCWYGAVRELLNAPIDEDGAFLNSLRNQNDSGICVDPKLVGIVVGIVGGLAGIGLLSCLIWCLHKHRSTVREAEKIMEYNLGRAEDSFKLAMRTVETEIWFNNQRASNSELFGRLADAVPILPLELCYIIASYLTTEGLERNLQYKDSTLFAAHKAFRSMQTLLDMEKSAALELLKRDIAEVCNSMKRFVMLPHPFINGGMAIDYSLVLNNMQMFAQFPYPFIRKVLGANVPDVFAKTGVTGVPLRLIYVMTVTHLMRKYFIFEGNNVKMVINRSDLLPSPGFHRHGLELPPSKAVQRIAEEIPALSLSPPANGNVERNEIDASTDFFRTSKAPTPSPPFNRSPKSPNTRPLNRSPKSPVKSLLGTPLLSPVEERGDKTEEGYGSEVGSRYSTGATYT